MAAAAAVSTLPLAQLRDAFVVFFDAVVASRQVAGNAMLQRELRMQVCPEDRIMERFIERGVSLTTTVQESLTWLDCLPEGRGLHDEWVEYKRLLSSYPAVRAMFNGFGYDRLFADRCYATISYVMLDDNQYWRATLPFPPSLPPTLEKLSRAIFDLDVVEVTKRRKITAAAAAVPMKMVDPEDFDKVRSACLDALDGAIKEWRVNSTKHQTSVNAHSRKFDEVRDRIQAASRYITDARDGLTQLLLRARDAATVTATYTDEVLNISGVLLTKIRDTHLHPTLIATSEQVKAFFASGPPVQFVAPVLDEHAFRHVRQADFERAARPLVSGCLDHATRQFQSARDMVLSAKSTSIFSSMADAANSVARVMGAGHADAWPAALRDAFKQHQTADAWHLARDLWATFIVPESGAAALAGSNFDQARMKGIRERLGAQIERLKNQRDPALRRAAMSHSAVFIGRFTEADTEADMSRLRVNDERQSSVQTFLADFLTNLQTNILPSLRSGQLKSVASFAQQHPADPMRMLPAVDPPWPINLAAFRALRTTMLELARKELPTNGSDKAHLVEVLRLESLGNHSGNAPSFGVIWNAVARLWILLLTHHHAA